MKKAFVFELLIQVILQVKVGRCTLNDIMISHAIKNIYYTFINKGALIF